ncbi:MAG TPA: hypothetical protein VFS39_07535 [Nitrospira sp.]|nr:hypothetical protein [Nitrospira sp.]
MNQRTGEMVLSAAEEAVSDNLDRLEAGVDRAVDRAKDTVHQLRAMTEEMTERTLTRVRETWERQLLKIEGALASHPWMVFGALVLLAYVFSQEQATRRGRHELQ